MLYSDRSKLKVEMDLRLCVVLLAIFHSGSALRCLQCAEVSNPRDCQVVVDCATNEVCFAESIVTHGGVSAYRIGCTSGNINKLCHGGVSHGVNPGEIIGKREHSSISAENVVDVTDDSPKDDSGVGYYDAPTDRRCPTCCDRDLCNRAGCHGPDITALRDCYDILKANKSTGDGLYTIYVSNGGAANTLVPVKVFCDMTNDGGGWTVFQYRFDGSVLFYRNFTEYDTGFGQWPGEFWLGLKWQHMITLQKRYELRIDFTAQIDNSTGQLRYSTFAIGPSPSYNLTLSGFNGTGYDAMNTHNGHGFSTFDKEYNDVGCASNYHGAFWYNKCWEANLNGRYGHRYGFNIWIRKDGRNNTRELVTSSMSVKPVSIS